MQDYEVDDIIENIPSLDRNTWEQTRLLLYQYIQSNSKKKYTLNDILEFRWDEKFKDNSKEISNSEIINLKNKAKEISNTYGKHTNDESNC